MLTRDMGGLTPLLGLIAQTLTADANGADCDLLGFGGVTVLFNVGNSGDTLSGSVEINLEVQHSDDASTWSACADTDIIDSVTGANTGTVAHIDAPAEDSAVFSTQYIGGKRYVRGVVNLVGTHSNGTPVSMTYIRFRPETS